LAAEPLAELARGHTVVTTVPFYAESGLLRGTSVLASDSRKSILRLAVLIAWKQKCALCNNILESGGMELDHLIPQSMSDTDRSVVLASYQLDATFDIEALHNRIPTCTPCNQRKRAWFPPGVPIVLWLLKAARDKVQTVATQIDQLARTDPELWATDAATILGRLENNYGIAIPGSDGDKLALVDIAIDWVPELCLIEDEDELVEVDRHLQDWFENNPQLADELIAATDGKVRSLTLVEAQKRVDDGVAMKVSRSTQ